jgi:hypothetical protein
MQEPTYPPRLSANSAIRVYRHWITWGNLRRLRPQAVSLFARVDPGEQTGFICLRRFRGSIMDRGAYFYAVTTRQAKSLTSRHFRLASGDLDHLLGALFDAIAWFIDYGGVKLSPGPPRTNTGLAHITRCRDRHDRVNLHVNLRAASGSFRQFGVYIGIPDDPLYPVLYEQGLALLSRVAAAEDEARAVERTLDTRAYRQEWRRVVAQYRAPRRRSPPATRR